MKIYDFLPNIIEYTSSEKTEGNTITTNTCKEVHFILNNEEIKAFEKFFAVHNAKNCFINKNDAEACFSFNFTSIKRKVHKRVICRFCSESMLLNAKQVHKSISETTLSKSNW